MGPGREPLGRTVDISFGGLGLDGAVRHEPPQAVILSYHGDRTQPSPVSLVRYNGRHMGLRFQQPQPEFLGKLSEYLADLHRRGHAVSSDGAQWEILADSTLLLLFGRSMAANHVRARVESPLGQILGWAALRRSRPRDGHLVMDWDWDGPWPPVLPCQLFFEGHNALYRLRVEQAEQHGPCVRTMGPAQIQRLQQRRFPRCAPAFPLKIQFEHPLIPGLTLAKKIADLSYDGLGFAVDVAQDLLAHDLALPEVSIILPDGDRLQATGHVCHNFERRVRGQVHCGIQIDDMSSRDSRIWTELVGRHHFPNVSRANAVALDALWDHYSASGYFSLSGKSPELFSEMRAPFVEVWSKINEGESMGQLAVWSMQSEVFGTTSLVRVYSRTMLIQGLATRKVEGQPGLGRRRISRDLYLSLFNAALLDPSVHYVQAFLCMGSAKRWHSAICDRFARTYPELSFSTPFLLMEAELDGIGGPGNDSSFIRPCTGDLLLERASSVLPPAVLEALDLCSEQLDLGRTNEILAPAGLKRERTLLCACLGEQPAAVSVIETCSSPVNPYGLLDSIRLFGLTDAGELPERLLTELLLASRRELFERGKKKCVFLADQSMQRAAHSAGFRHIDDGLLWLVQRNGLALFLSNIYEIIAPE